jgi:hypothetical protein
MSIKTDSYIKYPYEYIAAQMEFGARIVEITGKNPYRIYQQYTDIYGTLTNHKFAGDKKHPWVKYVLQELERILRSKRSTDWKTGKVYQLYMNIPLDEPASKRVSRKVVPDEINFGCFKLNNSKFYRSKKEVRLHFVPLRKGLTAESEELRTSDLAPVYLDERQNEFSEMINYIYENPGTFKGVTHFVSSSWLQNLPVYRSFFPENAERTRVEWGYLWLWGQFLKWDMTGNEKRLQVFKENLSKAESTEEIINAIPMQVYEVRIPLEDMFWKYVAGYEKNNDVEEDLKNFTDPVSLRFGTTRPARARTAGRSRE